MKSVILPIKKEFCSLIFNGRKSIEYRKRFPKTGIERILVYESRGVGKVIGELAVKELLHMPVDKLWEASSDLGGIDRVLFDKYFKGKERGFGIVIKDFVLYTEPKLLSDFGVNAVPQDYVYL